MCRKIFLKNKEERENKYQHPASATYQVKEPLPELYREACEYK